MTELTIELINRRQPPRDGARCTENCIEHWLKSGSADSAIPGLTRKLIRDHGVQPETLAVIVRDGVKVFKSPITLQEWGARRYVEENNGGIRIRKDGWRDFPTDDVRSLSAPEAKNARQNAGGYICQPEGNVTVKSPLTGTPADKEGPAATAIAPSLVNQSSEEEI